MFLLQENILYPLIKFRLSIHPYVQCYNTFLILTYLYLVLHSLRIIFFTPIPFSSLLGS